LHFLATSCAQPTVHLRQLQRVTSPENKLEKIWLVPVLTVVATYLVYKVYKVVLIVCAVGVQRERMLYNSLSFMWTTIAQ